jgi:hypothetical protein
MNDKIRLLADTESRAKPRGKQISKLIKFLHINLHYDKRHTVVFICGLLNKAVSGSSDCVRSIR